MATATEPNGWQRNLKVPQPVAGEVIPTGNIVLTTRSEAELRAVAWGRGLTILRQWPGVAVARGAGPVERLAQSLRSDGRIVSAFPEVRMPYFRDQFVPNDPFYTNNNPVGFPGQWYLNDTTAANLDVNAPGAWGRDWTGQGILVGIIDDGIEWTHPELTNQFSSAGSFDFGQNDTNPFPVVAEDNHGTVIAGLIAARGGNGIGVAGAAPRALFGGIRVDFDNLTNSQLTAAIHFLGGTSNTFRIKNHSYGPVAPYLDASAETTALASNTALGTIHVRSAGNTRGTIGEDTNKSGVRNTVNSIVVAAVGSTGVFATYGGFGASVFCAAPSGDDGTPTSRVIVSTDRTGANGYNRNTLATSDPNFDGDTFPNLDYSSVYGTGTEGGTSVAAALASGVIALAEQAQPALDIRFAKHLIARTARPVHLTDSSQAGDTWRTNGAGLRFNQNYGFGLIDADAMTSEAVRWSGTTPLATATSGTVTVAAAIPDNNAVGVSRTFTVGDPAPMEELLVTLNITHPWRGDLEAFVTSPRGTRSRLFLRAGGDDGDNVNWTFSSNAFWGEAANGTWTLQVLDTASLDTGTWNSFSATTRLGQLQRTVSGVVNLLDLVPTAFPVPVTLQLRDSGTDTVLQSQVVSIGPTGAFSFPTSLSGSVILRATASHWLPRRSAPFVLDEGLEAVPAMVMINGNADPNNEIGPADFSAVLATFGSEVGGPGYSELTDLNRDGEVGPADFSIVLASFGAEGDG